jgi:hypothetical protein
MFDATFLARILLGRSVLALVYLPDLCGPEFIARGPRGAAREAARIFDQERCGRTRSSASPERRLATQGTSFQLLLVEVRGRTALHLIGEWRGTRLLRQSDRSL